MAVQVYDPDHITPIELGWKLREAGYDPDKLAELGQIMGIDLLEILAGWAPVLVKVLSPQRMTWWEWLKSWFKRRK
jgi:hypothetical protein